MILSVCEEIVREKKGSNKEFRSIKFYTDYNYEFTIEKDLSNIEQEILSKIANTPDIIYVDHWSSIQEILQRIWKNSKIFYNYN